MVVLGREHGSTSSELFANLRIRSLVMIDVARERSPGGALRSADGSAKMVHVSDYRASESADLALTRGVFDHMLERDRAAAAVLMYRSLSSGGLFAVWQRNPWSPGAIWNARPAVPGGSGVLTARETRRLLRGVGFDIVYTTSPMFFPQGLSWCQPLEPFLAPIQLGREYMVLARKP